MTSDGIAKDDVKVPEGDLGKQIQTDFEAGKDLLVTIVSAMGEEMAISFKEVCVYFCFRLNNFYEADHGSGSQGQLSLLQRVCPYSLIGNRSYKMLTDLTCVSLRLC